MEGEARERIIVEVSFDHRRGCYVASHSALRAPATALSLAMLRRRVEDQLAGEGADIRLVLDKKARLERDQRRSGGHCGREQWRGR